MIVGKTQQDPSGVVWDLVRRQHGVVARSQLLALGIGSRSIEHRITKGRLYPLWRGIYAVGRTEVSQEGRWMAAVLACGPTALLSHRSAAELGLVVETDGWRHHRTSGEQATDRRRDQTHMTSGLTTVRFGEDQVRYEPEYVRRTLAAVIARLER